MTIVDQPPPPAPADTPARPFWRLLPDSRPPASSWTPPPMRCLDQPPLPLWGDLGPDEWSPPRTRTGTRPDPAAWSGRITTAVLQVLAGRRPVHQLDRWLDEDVLADIALEARMRHRRARNQGVEAFDTASTTGIVSVHVQRPSRQHVEAAVHVRDGRRSFAIALRLDAIGDRWLCTAFERGPGGLSC